MEYGASTQGVTTYLRTTPGENYSIRDKWDTLPQMQGCQTTASDIELMNRNAETDIGYCALDDAEEIMKNESIAE